MLVWQAGTCPHGAPTQSDNELRGSAHALSGLDFDFGLRLGSTLMVVPKTTLRG